MYWWRKLDYPEKTTDLSQVTDKLNKCIITSSWTGFELKTLVIISTDCIGSCKSNYHTVTTTTTPQVFTCCVFNNWTFAHCQFDSNIICFYMSYGEQNDSFSMKEQWKGKNWPLHDNRGPTFIWDICDWENDDFEEKWWRHRCISLFYYVILWERVLLPFTNVPDEYRTAEVVTTFKFCKEYEKKFL